MGGGRAVSGRMGGGRRAGDVFGGLAPRGRGRSMGGRNTSTTPAGGRNARPTAIGTREDQERTLRLDVGDLVGLFSPEPTERRRGLEFDTESVTEPYAKYADESEDGWITGVMRSSEKGYDLPNEVTLASAMKSPFRYYGGY